MNRTRQHAAKETDIHEHLARLHGLVLYLNAKRVIELGVRDGESTVALLEGVHETGGHLWSVDVMPCDQAKATIVSYGLQGRWTFNQADDVAFAQQWREGTVDLVFIDTSHMADHTRLELAAYHPLVAPHGAMAFHDTETFRDGVLVPILELMSAQPGRFALQNWRNNNGLGVLFDLRPR